MYFLFIFFRSKNYKMMDKTDSYIHFTKSKFFEIGHIGELERSPLKTEKLGSHN